MGEKLVLNVEIIDSLKHSCPLAQHLESEVILAGNASITILIKYSKFSLFFIIILYYIEMYITKKYILHL